MTYNRFSLTALLLCLYLFPILFIAFYGLQLSPGENNWTAFSAAILTAFLGTLLLFSLITQWESRLRGSFEAATLSKERDEAATGVSLLAELKEKTSKLESSLNLLQTERDALTHQLLTKEEQLRSLHSEYDLYSAKNKETLENLSLNHQTTAELLEEREESIRKLQTIASEQKEAIETLQQQVLLLQNKEEELNYEIKTLLQVSRMDDGLETAPAYELYATSSVIDEEEERQLDEEGEEEEELAQTLEGEEEAEALLKQCLETAARMNGLGNSRSSSLPVENYVLDMRRLCDNLRMETEYGIMLYSQKDSKPVFANAQIPQLLGWSSDKFVQIFPEIIEVGFQEWREGLKRTASTGKAYLQLPMKSKEGKKVILKCLLGVVENGIFRNHLFAILNFNKH